MAELEAELERQRRAYRSTPEAALRAELAKITGERAEAEARVDRERAEKHQALFEREQCRAHIHQLARALRRERERQATAERHAVEQLRVEYLVTI